MDLPRAITTYLDVLTDEQRDRVIQAMDWCSADIGSDVGPRCLVGHAEGVYFTEAQRFVGDRLRGSLDIGIPYVAFDLFFMSFGLDAVREIKAYAGRRSDWTTPAAARRPTEYAPKRQGAGVS